MIQTMSLIGGRALTTDGQFEKADVHVANGKIVEANPTSNITVDCRGLHVLPGMIDVHGDAFEMELFPRPGVDMPFDIAMRSVDRQLLGNGITTAFHGLSLTWEPGVRSLSSARRFMQEIARLRQSLDVDHRVQLRWETFAQDAIADLASWVQNDPAPSIAFNDHTTETMVAVAEGNVRKLEKWAQRAGLTVAEYTTPAKSIHLNATAVDAKIAEVAALARSHGVVALAHDERSLAERVTNRAHGMNVSEFPLSSDVAMNAVAHGEHVVMGAPNVLRRQSHKGDMSAEDAVRDGLCTVLASDYYYPAMLHAAEHLVQRGVCSMGEAWHLVSSNPASAMGLTDRGSLRPGLRADIVVVDCAAGWRVVHALAGGKMAGRSA